MAEPSGYTPKVRLPKGAPKELAEFLACTKNRVDIDLKGDFRWLAKAFKMPDSVTPTLDYVPLNGFDDGTLVIQFPGEYGRRIELDVSIDDGRLQIDAPEGSMERTIEGFADDINSDLAHGGHCLGPASYNQTTKVLTLTKKPLAESHGSVADETDESWLAGVLIRNTTSKPIVISAGIRGIHRDHGYDGSLSELTTELPAESQTLYEVGVRLPRNSPSEVVQRLVGGAPAAGRDSGSVVFRPVKIRLRTEIESRFEFGLRATTSSLDDAGGALGDEGSQGSGIGVSSSGQSAWLDGTLPAGPGFYDLTAGFDVRFAVGFEPEPADWHGIEFHSPGVVEAFAGSAALTDDELTAADLIGYRPRFVLRESAITAAPQGWDLFAPAWPENEVFLDAETEAALGADSAGCVKWLIWAGVPAAIVAAIIAILTLAGGNGDEDAPSDEVTGGDTEVSTDDSGASGDETAAGGEGTGATGTADDAATTPGDETSTGDGTGTGTETTDGDTSTITGQSAVSVVMLDLIGGTTWNLAGPSVESSNDDTVSATLVFPVVANGPVPALVGVHGITAEQFEQWAAEVFQEGASRQGCGQGEAASFVEGDVTQMTPDTDTVWCTQILDPTQLASVYAYQNVAPGLLADYLGLFDPSVFPGSGSLTYTLPGGPIQLEIPGVITYDIPLIQIDDVSFVEHWIPPPDISVPGGDGTGPAVLDVAAVEVGGGVIEVTVVLNGPFTLETMPVLAQVGVRVDDGIGGSVAATYGFANLSAYESGQDFRDLENLPEYPLSVEVSPDGSVVTFRLMPPDFLLGENAQVSAYVTTSEALDDPDPTYSEIGPVPIGG